MEESELVRAAQEGDAKAFASLFERYRKRTYGYFATRIRNADEADDLCQEAFLRAFRALKGLQRPESFGAWFFAVCRNCLRSGVREARDAVELDEALVADPTPGEWAGFRDAIRVARALLPDELRVLVQLRYDAGLSYAEAAATLGLDESLVKSRLFRARGALRSSVASLAEGALPDPVHMERIKEGIMDKMERKLFAARVLAGLSLADQVDMAKAANSGERFGATLLASIGRMRDGAKFVVEYNSAIAFHDFVEALNYVDRFTEKRLIEELDELDPALAEKLKENMFVFEDLTLCDAALLSYLHAHTPIGRMVAALSGVPSSIRDRIVAPLPEAERAALLEQVALCDAGAEEVKAAGSAIVEQLRAWDEAGVIKARRAGEVAPGEPFLTLAKGTE